MTPAKTKSKNVKVTIDKTKGSVLPIVETLASRQAAKRDRKNLRTRRHIAEVAVRIFEAKGFSATNVDEIADAADYSTSTFFRLFVDKEEVVFYDFAELLEDLKASFALPNHGNAWVTIRTVFIEIGHRWDVDEGELGIRRLRLIYNEPILYSRFLSKTSDWEVEMAKLISAEYKSDPEHDLLCQVSAGAAAAAFLAGWRIKLNDNSLSLADCVQNAFDQLERVGQFFRTPTVSNKKRRAN